MTLYPLFDTGFTFWKGDVDAMVSGRLGLRLTALGIAERELLAHYHAGHSAVRAADDIAARMAQAAE